MSKTWVSSSSTARPRPQRGRGTRAGSFSGPMERQQRPGDGRFAGRRSLREDEEWGQQTQARSSLSGGGFEDPAPMSISQVSGGQEERQLQRQGAYYVQPPKPSQAQKLKSVAEAETTAYNEHKREKRAQVVESLRHLQPQALGGSSPDAADTRANRVKEQEREQQLNAKYAGIIQKRKREGYMQEKRMREDRELEEKKKKQREKAERLEERKETDQHMKREEMRKARLARFDRQT